MTERIIHKKDIINAAMEVMESDKATRELISNMPTMAMAILVIAVKIEEELFSEKF